MDLPSFVVSIEIYAKVFFACPIFRDGIEILKHLHEVFGVLFSEIFHSKIINAEGKKYSTPLVRP